ncbi:ABC transporter substrate-binding protein [Natronobacterium gregoryi]|uniref:Glycine/betaine ABC transporter substrate-binding protein n=2 Tax=Natronobacterium gregoryi TaxID=44930 RepID=L0AK31_NATGS|nr:glycine betaine ABC transporter substrate-binding protein [Natronobacterium gregoryi]AFZ74248.1 periplasmic glycine betaine/choline-binding (lipo)protein of an ABC-type transport system (osmoprotectant binding protein) [Natronobacterium gregoryi SP2]PLK21967.1 glycine/betaine ABC transporter substrate-binding protein [Natronobacterium gregoryi SP2]SFI52307.1 osmoprotectant transport system substrate-binding protein [Natronobacterium gregoryi]
MTKYKTDVFSRRSLLSAGGAVASAGLLAGCSAVENSSVNGGDSLEVVVGSKNFTESILLSYMAYELLDANTDASVVDETNYGNNAETWGAFEDGTIDFYWDYTGTLWLTNPPQNDEPVIGQEEQYEAVKEEAEAEHDLEVLDMAPFENTWALVTHQETIAETGIETLSDLAAYVDDGNYDLSVAVEDDFYERNDGWPGLVDHYDFDDEALAEWEQADGVVVVNVGLTYDEVELGTADLGVAYSTNAQLATYELELLEDDDHFWPAYNPIPVISEEASSPDVRDELNRIGSAIGGPRTMQELNARVDVDGEDPQDVATSFLTEQGLI